MKPWRVPWGATYPPDPRDEGPTSAEINADVRSGLADLEEMGYGWGPQHDGLTLRPDVRDWVLHTLCRGDNPLLAYGGLESPEILMDERGVITLRFRGAGRSLVLAVPAEGVVIARQRFGGDSFVEGRLAGDDAELARQLDELREWVGKGGQP